MPKKGESAEVGRRIYASVTEAGGGRAEFMEQFMKETGSSKGMASTYYYNNDREAKGVDMYANNLTPKQRREKNMEKALISHEGVTARDADHTWRARSEDVEYFFPSRSKAQNFNKTSIAGGNYKISQVK